LLLHAAAYWLLDTLRRLLIQAGIARTQLGTLQLCLIKIGGCLREQAQQVLERGRLGQSTAARVATGPQDQENVAHHLAGAAQEASTSVRWPGPLADQQVQHSPLLVRQIQLLLISEAAYHPFMNSVAEKTHACADSS
jgi:hypothetical protein